MGKTNRVITTPYYLSNTAFLLLSLNCNRWKIFWFVHTPNLQPCVPSFHWSKCTYTRNSKITCQLISNETCLLSRHFVHCIHWQRGWSFNPFPGMLSWVYNEINLIYWLQNIFIILTAACLLYFFDLIILRTLWSFMELQCIRPWWFHWLQCVYSWELRCIINVRFFRFLEYTSKERRTYNTWLN